VLVNKKHPLQPKTYVPAQLAVPDLPFRSNITDDEKQVASVITQPLKNLVTAAQKDNIMLNVQSGYRSYQAQSKLYAQFVALQGKHQADIYSAQAGYSEHQTGLAVDMGTVGDTGCNVRDCFATTPEANWLATHAYKYGFIIRYPKDKQRVTGYGYEPWHIRYVGTSLANTLHAKSSTTLEDYFTQSF
jgi:D-alanyl-D-alanine carboxypeptidase